MPRELRRSAAASSLDPDRATISRAHRADHPIDYPDFEAVIPEGTLRGRPDDRLGPGHGALSRDPAEEGVADGEAPLLELAG